MEGRVNNEIGVAETKRRFSELLDRVAAGERFVIERRGRRVAAIVPPDEAEQGAPKPAGILSLIGALADWDDLEDTVRDIYAARRRAKDRPPPDLD